MKTEKTIFFNGRKRKAEDIVAIIRDAAGKVVDAIFPGVGNHKVALDWFEWRIQRIPTEYEGTGAVEVQLYVGKDIIAYANL